VRRTQRAVTTHKAPVAAWRQLVARATRCASSSGYGMSVRQGHDDGNTSWRTGDDEGKQRRCVVAFDGGRQAPMACEALQHEVGEGEVSGGLI
jgi:hypothetical protein